MRYAVCVTLAFALVIGAFMLGAWSIHEVVQIGTCASGGPYVSARPCPKGTEFKILAIFGAVHAAFVILYMVPCQWLATHSDPFPAGYPSYLTNGMCQSGADGRTCPGPGIPMPRPAETKIF